MYCLPESGRKSAPAAAPAAAAAVEKLSWRVCDGDDVLLPRLTTAEATSATTDGVARSSSRGLHSNSGDGGGIKSAGTIAVSDIIEELAVRFGRSGDVKLDGPWSSSSSPGS